MDKKTIVIGVIAAVVILGIGIWIYTGMNGAATSQILPETTSDTTTTSPPAATPPVAAPQPQASGSEKDFTVTGQNYSFTPSALTVNKCDTVKITFKNANGYHDLRLDDFNVATTRISSGEEATITFVADKTGSFEYYCSVGDHRAAGMKGTLVVR